MKKILILLMFMSLVGCTSNVSSDPYQENSENVIQENSWENYHYISPDTAKQMMDQKSDYVLLDVRTHEEFLEGHINNAINVPLDEINKDVIDILKDKSQVVLIYCRSGNRSKVASAKLLEMGYKNIFDFGGLQNWEYEIVA